jgi:molecular chaperone HtpG
MTNSIPRRFPAGIDFPEVLGVLSKQIYETPLAFLRENVQNAVDAIRIAALRRGLEASDPTLSVRVSISDRTIEIADNGIGMSPEELEQLFWTIGASGKRTPEARAAGCVGMFGIGGFANFGVCQELIVISRPGGAERGYWTRLTRTEIDEARPGLPEVQGEASDEPTGSGTIVRGILQDELDHGALREYLKDFVRYATEHVYFQGELVSREERLGAARRDRSPVRTEREDFEHGSIKVRAELSEDSSHALYATLTGLQVAEEDVRLTGLVKFENGPLDVLKRGFKICATTLPTQIGISGNIDCDRLAPTAGRDSLNAESTALISSIGSALERAAVLAILDSSERVAQHTRIFRYVRSHGLFDHMGLVEVNVADGARTTLGEIKRRAEHGVVVHFATGTHKNLAEVLNARGHIVVQLPADSHKLVAVREYLTRYCKAQPLEGRVECTTVYEELTRFEKAFLSELEETVVTAYEAEGVKIVPGELTEDIPIFVAESRRDEPLFIYVDVRHDEITKLQPLGITPLFSSLVASFCREYLAGALRSRSPKFFGSGAVNLDWLSKRRSELWVLMTNDIHTLNKGVQQVVRPSDVQVVTAGPQPMSAQRTDPGRQPKLIRIEGADAFAHLSGYYLRIPNPATEAFGDVILEADYLGSVWVGNKIMLVASDAISTAFQFEVRLDRLIIQGEGVDSLVNAGAGEIDRPIHALFGGLYFPIPSPLERFLVPGPQEEIRIEVRTEWVDFSSARSWQPREETAQDRA